MYPVQSTGWIYKKIAAREQWGLAGSRAGMEVSARFNIIRQVHGAEAGRQSCWKVNPQVITRPTEGQSPVITGQVHGDGVRQKTGQEVRSNRAQRRTKAPRLTLIRAPGRMGKGVWVRVPGEAGQGPDNCYALEVLYLGQTKIISGAVSYWTFVQIRHYRCSKNSNEHSYRFSYIFNPVLYICSETVTRQY